MTASRFRSSLLLFLLLVRDSRGYYDHDRYYRVQQLLTMMTRSAMLLVTELMQLQR